MKKVLSLLVLILIASLFIFSLSFADWSNYAEPQLEFISNAFPQLWNKGKTYVAQVMSIFPDYICKDYGDQYACTSKYNYDRSSIFINFFMDDYEEHHDNLWKVSVTVDVNSQLEMQQLFNILWIDGMKPFHSVDDDFSFKGVVPLYFDNESTSMVVWFQRFDISNNPFLLVEYYNGYMQ